MGHGLARAGTYRLAYHHIGEVVFSQMAASAQRVAEFVAQFRRDLKVVCRLEVSVP